MNTFTFSGENLIGTVGANIPNAPALNTAPILLAPLANYGGPTETRPPLPGSPAIDAATSSTNLTDQAGLPTIGTPDLGASEFTLASVITVTTDADELDAIATNGTGISLREAIRDLPGGIILFEESLDGLILLDASLGPIVIDKSLTIDASALPNGVIIDGGSNGDLLLDDNETRCLFISDGDPNTRKSVTLKHLTIQNGVIVGNSSPDLADIVAPFSLVAKAALSETPPEKAGANLSNRESLTLEHCQILNGTALLAELGFGGLPTSALGENGETEFPDPRNGGGGIFSSGGSLTMISCLVSGNRSAAAGGGIRLAATSATLQSCQILENSILQGEKGGGIFTLGGSLTILDSTISRNQNPGSSADGGGISATGTDVIIEDSTLSENSSGRFGGAVGISKGNRETTANFIRCTLSGNSAGEEGGGCNIRFQTVNFIHCTIIENSAEEGAGIFCNAGGGSINSEPVTLTASIVRENSGGDLGFQSVNLFFSGGDNLVGTGATERFSPAEINTFPLFLGPLSDNGGPTETHLPLSNSFVVNGASGSDATVDQRGFPIIDTPDIGAAEFQGTPTPFPFSDTDADGLTRILELAIGTDPDLADFESTARPTIGEDANGNIAITFGRGATPLPGTFLIIERSTDLQTFEEIYRFDFDADLSTPGTNITEDLQANQFIITDETPGQQRAFYRLTVFPGT
ncbi:right-handed parallel beta-helix repeat-containing protein [bacterium]|nr:right-handed parallel beta-helix repeat-containing protein [bacterium]